MPLKEILSKMAQAHVVQFQLKLKAKEAKLEKWTKKREASEKKARVVSISGFFKFKF